MLFINPAFAPGRTRRARRRRLAKPNVSGLPSGVTARFDPTGQVSQMAYDSKGQLSAITLAALVSATSVPVINAGATTPATIPTSQRKVTLGYNAAGDVNVITDALGQETRLNTDALGRQTGSTHPLGYSSSQQYNQLDQPTGIIGVRLQLNPVQKTKNIHPQRGGAMS